MSPKVAALLEGIEAPAPLRVDADGAIAVARRIRARVAQYGIDVPLRLWDGRELGPADTTFRVVLHHPWSLRAMLLPGTDLTTGEAFVYDAFDVEGSMVDAMEAVAEITRQPLRFAERLGLVADLLRLPKPPPRSDRRQAALSGSVHSHERDASAVRFHYDVGNDFYGLFLDRNLVYSCAYFDDENLRMAGTPADDALDAAQARKLDLICRKLLLGRDDHLLDIGCGWGALAIHAAQHHGARVTGVTLSERQAERARRRVHELGLAGRVVIDVCDYREVVGRFDAVASVGMVEHVGAGRLQAYFDTVCALTAPGGRFLNHGITTGLRNSVRDLDVAEDSFIARYVFPDGSLVPEWRVVMHMQGAGFEIHDLEQLRPHYAKTLRCWVQRLEANADRARHLADDQTYRIWRAYMAGSVVGFESGDLGVVQLLGTRPAARPVVLPAGRQWMQPRLP